MELAVVYPVYNEVDILEDTARRTIEFLKETDINSFKTVFVTDGSTDGTQDEADRLEKEIHEVKHLRYGERLGKGLAFEKAFNEIEAEKFIYSDADLSTDLKHIRDAVNHLDNGHDIAAGSRRIDKDLDRGFRRKVPSIVFNELIRKGFGSRVRDHQCGFKAFNAEAVEDVFSEVEGDHWFWDAEMLVKAQRKGKSIREFSVDWEESSDSKVNVFRDSIYFLRKTVELRIELWR